MHLLNGKNELLIDDDDTKEDNKKYMKIYKDDNKINIIFINTLNCNVSFEKYHILVKNIGYDVRSKIDEYDKDAKIRLFHFYREVYESFNKIEEDKLIKRLNKNK